MLHSGFLRISCCMVALLLGGCSSVVTSSLAFAVSKNSEIQAKRNKRYNVLLDCTVEGKPDAYALSLSIENGAEITDAENRILNVMEEDAEIPPLPRHRVSYAFLVIADRIGDARAEGRKAYYIQKYPNGELEDIEDLVEYKYYLSYLKKCFLVPGKYQLHKSFRLLHDSERDIL